MDNVVAGCVDEIPRVEEEIPPIDTGEPFKTAVASTLYSISSAWQMVGAASHAAATTASASRKPGQTPRIEVRGYAASRRLRIAIPTISGASAVALLLR